MVVADVEVVCVLNVTVESSSSIMDTVFLPWSPITIAAMVAPTMTNMLQVKIDHKTNFDLR